MLKKHCSSTDFIPYTNVPDVTLFIKLKSYFLGVSWLSIDNRKNKLPTLDAIVQCLQSMVASKYDFFNANIIRPLDNSHDTSHDEFIETALTNVSLIIKTCKRASMSMACDSELSSAVRRMTGGNESKGASKAWDDFCGLRDKLRRVYDTHNMAEVYRIAKKLNKFLMGYVDNVISEGLDKVEGKGVTKADLDVIVKTMLVWF